MLDTSNITQVTVFMEAESYILSKTTLTLIVQIAVISSTVKTLIQSSLLTKERSKDKCRDMRVIVNVPDYLTVITFYYRLL